MYYTPLPWAKMSDDMHNELIALAHDSVNIRPANRRHVDRYHHYALPKHIEDWCRNNLPITDLHICVVQRFFNTIAIPKHIDGTRTETLNYILSDRGPTTRWFSGDTVIESVVLPQHQWFQLNVSVAHDVIQIERDRIAVSIFIPF